MIDIVRSNRADIENSNVSSLVAVILILVYIINEI